MIETAIVIIHYENVELTEQCIKSIKENTTKYTYHIIVVDNNSPTEYKPDCLSDRTVIRNNDRHNVSGINFGLYYAIYTLTKVFDIKYVVVFDNDIICQENWLPPLIKAMEDNPTVGIVGGKQWDVKKERFRSVGVDLMGMLVNNLPNKDINVVWIQGSFHMYRVEMMKMIGLHDTRYKIICSDSDYCLHANDRGWNVRFVNDSNVIHIQNASYKGVCETETEDKTKLLQKWCGLKFNALMKVFPISITDKQYGVVKYSTKINCRPATIFISKLFNSCEICGAEIGVRYGDNAENMLFYIPNIKKLYLVDNNADGFMDIARKRFSETEEVEIIEKNSVNAAKDIKDESLDFVYIDADHSYYGVKNDIEAWLPKVKKGGVVSGHDYIEPDETVSDFDVIKAVDEAFGRENVTVEVRDWWVIKK